MAGAAVTASGAALAAIDALEASFGQQAWFATLGEPPTEAEVYDIRGYLDGLGLGGTMVAWVEDLDVARDVARSPDWSRDWAAAERSEVEHLSAELDTRLGRPRATDRLNRLMAGISSMVIGPAAAAAARFGIADPGLHRAMAGAAAQAAFERALAAAAQTGRTHPFAAKYRLFAGGRWPLALAGGSFHIL